MVLFGTKETHCVSSMDSLVKLRQDDSLCDAYLVVGHQRIPAHRCVLVARSDYFRARFIGPLRDEDKDDVDLSFVANNAVYVEKVIDFMYEGVIDIDQENLEAFLKLASFLLISKLKEYCSIFMEKTRSVNTIVKYYILSADYAIDGIEKSLKETVRTRFHDWLIFDESVLQVTPDQIRFLMEACDIFHYCAYTDMLKFITEWVKKGKSESHDNLGCELLELLSKIKHHCYSDKNLNEEKSNIIETLKLSLRDKGPESDFMFKLHQLLDDLNIEETSADNMKSESPSDQLDTASSRSTICDSEPMVLAISPKPCLKKALESRSQTNTEEDNELPFESTDAIFDICVYVPRTRTWYHLNEGQYRGFYKNIVYEEGNWHFTARMDTMYCLSPYARRYGKMVIDLLSLHDFSFRKICYRYALRLEPELSSQNMIIVSDDNSVYLVSLISGDSYFGDFLGSFSYFKCFKLTSSNEWEFVFRSPTIENKIRYGGIFSAAFSAISNEMLLIYGIVIPESYSSYAKLGPDWNPAVIQRELFAFVADIGHGGSSKVKVKTLSAGFHGSRPSCSWGILQDENQFYLLENEYLNTGFRLAYRYKYVYHSKCLTPVSSNEEVIGESIIMKGEEPESLYMQYVEASNDGRSVWLFNGNDQNSSTLTEATVGCDGSTVFQAHKPPPFTCVTAFMAGKINRECLAGSTPVARYLEA